MANNVVADPQPVTLETAAGVATGTAASPLRVDPTGTTTQPVSGTVTVNEPVSVDDNGGSLTVDGAVAATQSGTWTVDPTTSTSWGLRAEDSGHTTGDTGMFVLGVRNAATSQSSWAGANGDYSPISVDAQGNPIIVNRVVSGSLGDGASNTANLKLGHAGSGFVDVPYPYYFNGTTWDRTRGTAADGALVNLGTNNDVTVTGTVTEANSAAIKTAVETIDNAISGSEMQVDVVAALPAGTNLIGAATPGASATVGTALTKFRDPAVTNTAVAIKASAGKLHWYNLYNPNASLAYVHFYNVAAASVTVGTTTPAISIALPSTANGTVAVDSYNGLGLDFSTAISVAASTTATGGIAPSTALVVNAGSI